MKCSGCGYSGKCSDGSSGMPSASYLANMGNYGVGASYSHVSSGNSNSYASAENLPAIAYDPSTSNSLVPSYSSLPSQLDYHISKALLELSEKKKEVEEVSSSNNTIREIPSAAFKYEIVPMQPSFALAEPENQAMLAEMQKNEGFLPLDQGIPQDGAVRLTQTDIEEDLLIMRRTRIRQRSMTFLNGAEQRKEPKRIN